jgi:hypothetical protein
MKYTLEEMITEVDREIAFRKLAYPRRIRNGIMTQFQSNHYQNVMLAIRDVLSNLKAAQNGVAKDERRRTDDADA